MKSARKSMYKEEKKHFSLRLWFKKVALWSVVITTLFNAAAFAALTTTTTNLTMGNAQSDMEEAARVMVVTHALIKCVKISSTYIYFYPESPTASIEDDDYYETNPKNLFDPDGTEKRAAIGAWLENAITGNTWDSTLNGRQYCDELLDQGEDRGYTYGVLTAFAKRLGLEDRQVICNKNDSSRPGLFSAWWNNAPEPEQNCWNYFEDSGLEYSYYPGSGGGAYFGDDCKEGVECVDGIPYNNGLDYIKALYTSYKKQHAADNPYILDWDYISRDDFKSWRGYYTLKLDFDTACDKVKNKNNYDAYTIEVTDTAGLEYKYWKLNEDNNTQYSITGQTRTCEELAGRISELASEYRVELAENFKDECDTVARGPWFFARRKAEIILNPNMDSETGVINGVEETFANYTTTTKEDGTSVTEMIKFEDADKAEAQRVLAEYERLFPVKYTEEKEGGALECIVPEGYTVDMAPHAEDPVDPTLGSSEAVCSNQGGAKALGWIVCPILEWLGDASKGAYEDYLVPQLRVEPRLFSSTAGDNKTGSNTETAWGTFRNMANILFSIILLIVIFSQLTGVGIDNYGIKRILPKLILTAVLANLSYVICQLAVDLSNILGNSLQNLFDGMVDKVYFSIPNSDISGQEVAATTMTGVLILTTVVIAVGTLWANPAILLSLLVGALGVLIAILFIFILLAARQAAVVILVVISPLAFVCYALPNTKKLFDKWLKLMQGLLIVYPICGILIGGGNFASRLLLASGLNNTFASALTAMLVSIVPLFFVPTVLKNSLNALGGLGNKISGVGRTVGSGTKNTVKGFRAYKDAQRRSNERGDRIFAQRRAGVHVDRNGNVVNNRFRGRIRRGIASTGVGRFLGMDAAGGAAQSQYIKSELDRQANANTFNNRGIIQTQVTKAQNAEDERIINGEVGTLRNTDEARDNIRTKAQNALDEMQADFEVPVVRVEYDLALKRRQASADAQELKNWTDQLANADRSTLEQHMNSASTWFNPNQRGSTQRMQALVSAMESRGMESDIFRMLENNGSIGNDTAVMQTLTGSKNRVLKAYGKKGGGMSYRDFMTNGTMANYAKEKGADFINDLDDKALTQIQNYENQGARIMSDEMVAQAASRITSQDAVNVLDNMIRNRGGSVEFTASQFANLNQSTRDVMFNQAQSGNTRVTRNIIRISNDIANDPQLRGKFNGDTINKINAERAKGNYNPI